MHSFPLASFKGKHTYHPLVLCQQLVPHFTLIFILYQKKNQLPWLFCFLLQLHLSFAEATDFIFSGSNFSPPRWNSLLSLSASLCLSRSLSLARSLSLLFSLSSLCQCLVFSLPSLLTVLITSCPSPAFAAITLVECQISVSLLFVSTLQPFFSPLPTWEHISTSVSLPHFNSCRASVVFLLSTCLYIPTVKCFFFSLGESFDTMFSQPRLVTS